MLPPNLIGLLKDWVARSWIRPLDLAFAEFLKEQQPDSPNLVLFTAALASHQLGRGHVCLDLKATLAEPDESLSLPPEDDSFEQLPDTPSRILDGIDLETWQKYLLESPLVTTGDGNTPLVLSTSRLYLRRYWQYTRQVAQGILERLQHKLPTPPDLTSRLDRLFTPLRSPEEQTKTQIHWQSVAAAVVTKSTFSIISGGPGTGKTTTVVHLLALFQELALVQGHKLRIRLAAPTGKAAARLSESVGRATDHLPDHLRNAPPYEVTTLHRLLGSQPDTRQFTHNAQNPLHVDCLVVDEASMINLELMAAILEALPPQARLIILGDKDQLASVEAGAVLGDLCQNAERSDYLPDTTSWIKKNTGYTIPAKTSSGRQLEQHIVVLRKNHRFGEDSGIGALARAVNTGDPVQVNRVWDEGYTDISRVDLHRDMDKRFERLLLDGHCEESVCNPLEPAGYRTYLQRIKTGVPKGMTHDDWLQAVLDDYNRFQLLSPLRKGYWGVEKLNQIVANILYRSKLISAVSGWYPGRPVMLTRNNYDLGLMNGDTGIVMPVTDAHDPDQNTLKAVFPMPDGSLKKVSPSRLDHLETVFVMTVHKSQGSEFDHTALIFPDNMSPVITRELTYTAITRSRSHFTLIGSRLDLMAKSANKRVRRASGLCDILS